MEFLLILSRKSSLLDGFELETRIVVLLGHCSIHHIMRAIVLNRCIILTSVNLAHTQYIWTITFRLLIGQRMLERTRIDLDRPEFIWQIDGDVDARLLQKATTFLVNAWTVGHLEATILFNCRRYHEITDYIGLSHGFIQTEMVVCRHEILLQASRVTKFTFTPTYRRIGGKWTRFFTWKTWFLHSQIV